MANQHGSNVRSVGSGRRPLAWPRAECIAAEVPTSGAVYQHRTDSRITVPATPPQQLCAILPAPTSAPTRKRQQPDLRTDGCRAKQPVAAGCRWMAGSHPVCVSPSRINGFRRPEGECDLYGWRHRKTFIISSHDRRRQAVVACRYSGSALPRLMP